MTYYHGKPSARRAIWEKFPPENRTPRFFGERQAAEQLFRAPPLQNAKAIKVGSERTLREVRRLALERGIEVYVARPRLVGGFRKLDPATRKVSTVAIADLPPFDAIVVGSVVVTYDGYRAGRGQGMSDLEWAVLREHGRPRVPVLTVAHPEQFVKFFPSYDHDMPIFFIATPSELITFERPVAGAREIDWERLERERIEEIPILKELRRQKRSRR